MSIKIGSIHAIGPKTKAHRHYRVTKVSDPQPYGRVGDRPTNFMRTVTLTNAHSGTTWQVHVKPEATRIPWNVRPLRVVTDADRAQAMKLAREDVFNRITDHLADLAATHLPAGYREDMYPAVSRVTYTYAGRTFTARVVKGPNLITWGAEAPDTHQSNDAGDLTDAFTAWCESLTS